MLKYYDARHQDLLEGGVLPDAPPESKRERWWVAKMTLHCRGDRVVFTLVKLRWVAPPPLPHAPVRVEPAGHCWSRGSPAVLACARVTPRRFRLSSRLRLARVQLPL